MNLRAVAILGIIFGAAIIAGVIIMVMAPKIKDGLKIKALRRLVHLFETTGISGLVYLFFAWQGVALLAARLWLLIIALMFVIWLGFILKYLYLVVPKRRAEIDSKRKFQKYIP